jgi:predicted amidohydrolase
MSIVGFTELGTHDQIYNSAVVFHGGRVVGIYRKMHPAIRRSVYTAGTEAPVFRFGEIIFGIVICNDSNFPMLAQRMAADGARILFVPTNCSLPEARAYPEIVGEARAVDARLATENKCWVVRADVAGECGGLRAWGCSGITNPAGIAIKQTVPGYHGLIVAEIVLSHS